jgi:hypothetical protein
MGREGRNFCPCFPRYAFRFPHLAEADLLVQSSCCLGGLDAQFLRQAAFAGLVLRQGGTALAAQSQQAHQLPVRLFKPRLQPQLLAGIRTGFFQLSPALMLFGKLVQGSQSLAFQLLPHYRRPGIELRAVLERKPLQEGPPVQARRLLQPLERGLTGTVALQEGTKSPHIQPVVAGGVEPDRLALDEQKWGRVLGLFQHLAQVGEGVAQAGSSRAFQVTRPEQACQGRSAVRAGSFHRQVG